MTRDAPVVAQCRGGYLTVTGPADDVGHRPPMVVSAVDRVEVRGRLAHRLTLLIFTVCDNQ